MSKKYTLPPNCEIEVLDYDRKERPFRLHFYAEKGEDYLSEVYYPAKGQRLKAAAYEICARYGWLDFPPATGILTREQLLKLDAMVDDAIYDMDAHPERYVPDPEKAWREMFDWDDEDREFYCDGNDLLACGDPPVPSPDCDLESGWTSYNYTQDVYRVIPESVRGGGQVRRSKVAEPRKGPRGIEVVTFHSGDMDGNWEVEAHFVRHQPGVKITAADRERVKIAAKAHEEAREACNAASQKDSNYRDLYTAWVKTETAHKLAKAMVEEDIEEESWDPDDFRCYAVQLNAYWTLLRYKRYEIWCALHGEDPLGNVMAESETVSGTFSVVARQRRGKVEVQAELLKGDPRLKAKAIAYVEGYSLEELKQFVREQPEGKQHQYGGEEDGWKPGKVTVASVELIVTLTERFITAPSAQRIRQVSCKGLEEDVKRMMSEIEKRYPK